MVLLFVTSYQFVERLPKPWPARLEPWVFVGPALFMLIWTLALPALRTILLSFQDANSVGFVGLQNYTGVFSDPGMLTVFRNNLLWMLIGTTFTVSFGLLVAVLADRSRFETLAKALIFLPMAISFVGAGVIWNFVYAAKPVDAPQIGLLNSIVVALGGKPEAWTAFYQPWNNFFLIAIVIWLQTGYSMVLFSAAIKGIPSEMLEAARVDGANEVQIFFSIMIPYIMGTIITVSHDHRHLHLENFRRGDCHDGRAVRHQRHRHRVLSAVFHLQQQRLWLGPRHDPAHRRHAGDGL